jgi:hypothetical protein
MSKSISDIFDITPVPPAKLPVILAEHKDVDRDADEARANLKSLIQQATNVLENAIHVAIESESPKSYEVVANLLSTAADLNSKLMETHNQQQKVRAQMKPAEVNATQNNTTHNNVMFTGTPDELSNFLKGK